MSNTFDLRHLRGPCDVIGDLHGCVAELWDLLRALGYRRGQEDTITHRDGRRIVFVGDLADRGPHNAEAFRLVMQWVSAGVALYTPGNHCNKLMRALQGRRVTLNQGLDATVTEVYRLDRARPGFQRQLLRFIEESPPYLWLDGGDLVVAHGGIKKPMIGRDDGKVRAMVLYGDTTGASNRDGTPVRLDWAASYSGRAAVIYGHTPTALPRWRNNTANVDQGCVFGGWLTALRWPERDFVQVPARAAYYIERTPPFIAKRVERLQSVK